METTETKTNPFKEYVNSIPVGEYDEKREEIINRCHINAQIYRNWKNGITPVPELAKPVINDIAGKEIFEIINN